MDERMQLFGFHVSFSLRYHLLFATGICSLNRAFIRFVMHCISTELRKLCSNLAAIKKFKKIFFELRRLKKTSFSTSFFV